jgi:8-oxo-dGTP pyrophosphatase MutT (NUDIX family)
MKPWEVLTADVILDRPYLRVETQKVRLGSGAVMDDFQLITAPAWVGVIALTPRQDLVLVEQYRHAHEGTSLELPAGIIEPGEEVSIAARRELREETGFEAPSVASLWQIRPEPARHRQWAHFCVARDVVQRADQSLDATEDIRVVLRPLSKLDSIVSEMVHAAHVAALLLAARRGLLG